MKTPATAQKLRGAYYTPPPIAKFLTKWAVRSQNAHVLEPCCGDGVFLESAATELLARGATPASLAGKLRGIELNAGEADKAKASLRKMGVPATSKIVASGDFFGRYGKLVAKGEIFDAVVGNPPFIRYQYFPENQRQLAFGLMESAGLHPNRLTNAWVPFLVGCTKLLKPKGRLAMVIPAELLQVNYAAELRRFLSDYFSKLTLITFRKLVFGKIQQEVVLVLGERNGRERTGVRTFELDTIDDLEDFVHTDFEKAVLKPLDHTLEKWTQYFLTSEQILFLRRLGKRPDLTRAGEILEVDVGVVTGLNDFFVMTSARSESLGLREHLAPLVARSAHLAGIRFTGRDWKKNDQAGLPTLLLSIDAKGPAKISGALASYVREAEGNGWNKGYKCRIRNPWYVVPYAWVPDAFLLRQIHNHPKLVINSSGATSTDTIHRVRFKAGIDGTRLSAAFLNSLTFAHAEVVGRSYGGGVLELEPREAESLLIPVKGSEKLDPGEIDRLMREGRVDEVLAKTDRVLLHEGLGLSWREIGELRDIWATLRDRRAGRKHVRTKELLATVCGLYRECAVCGRMLGGVRRGPEGLFFLRHRSGKASCTGSGLQAHQPPPPESTASNS